MTRQTDRYTPPDWAFEFHGHRCSFMVPVLEVWFFAGQIALHLRGIV